MSGRQTLSVMTLNMGRLFHPYPAASIEFAVRPEWDIICLQDVPRYVVDDVRFKNRWPIQHFVPMTNHFMRGNVRILVGVGIFSQKLPFISTAAHAYVGRVSPVLDLDGVAVDADGNASPTDLARLRHSESRIVVFAEIEAGEAEFKIGTTHGAWVPKGQTDDHQRVATHKLLSIIEKQGALVMAGDFNAPRGGEIYRILTQEEGFEDCVPSQIVKTRDFGPDLNAPELVVDYFFKRGEIYKVADVKAHTCVSDHYALSATISRN